MGRKKQYRRKKKPSSYLSMLGGLFVLFIFFSIVGKCNQSPNSRVTPKSKATPAPRSEQDRYQIWMKFAQAQEDILQEVTKKYPQTETSQTIDIERDSYQKKLLDDMKTKIMQQEHVTNEELQAIQIEGLSKSWRLPIKWDISEDERKKIFVKLYQIEMDANEEARSRRFSSTEEGEYFETALVNAKRKEIMQKYHLTTEQLDAIQKEGAEKQWTAIIPSVEATKTPIKGRQTNVPAPLPVPATRYSCSPAKTCGEMKSCQEAYYHLNQCKNSTLDTDHDGIPCENTVCK